jgi:septal ring factor EnvC (AmiA/AmiB activator)
VTFNNGIDIQASSGSPIRAVAAGRVEFVDWIEGYENCIIFEVRKAKQALNPIEWLAK